MSCPIARSLERVGEWWSVLILREALAGAERFEDFRAALPIASNTLTRRLGALVDAGLLERHPYSNRPLRHAYVLTAVGRDVHPVLISLLAWGNRHFAPEGPSVVLVDRVSGRIVEPVLVERRTGRPITLQSHGFAAGPAASDSLRERFAACRVPQSRRVRSRKTAKTGARV
jgi:DNA-binding HxlR family transcriptional regulator